MDLDDQLNSTSVDLILEQQEQRLRDHLHQACRLAQELDQQLNIIPAGKLAGNKDRYSSSDSEYGTMTSEQLQCSLAMASAKAASSFSQATEILLMMSSSTSEQYSSYTITLSAANSPKKACSSDKRRRNDANSSNWMIVNRLSLPEHQARGSPKRIMNTPIQSPRKLEAPNPNCIRTQVADREALNSQETSMNNMVTITAPGVPIPSPVRTQSPVLSPTSCELSDNSALIKQQLDSSSAHFGADETTTTADPAAGICSRKRYTKVQQPKYTFRLRGGGDIGKTPPEDGYTWRKYGQKEILGAKHQRSYFRCTHKIDMECHAIKHVQQCENDESFFNVTYTGHHICRSIDQRWWPFASPVHYQQQHMQDALNMLPSASTSILNSVAVAMLSNSNSSNNKNDNNGLAHHLHKNVHPITSSLPLPTLTQVNTQANHDDYLNNLLDHHHLPSPNLSFSSTSNHSNQDPYTSTKHHSLHNLYNVACSSGFIIQTQEKLSYVSTQPDSNPEMIPKGIDTTQQQPHHISLALRKEGSSNEKRLKILESEEHGQDKRVMCFKEQGLAFVPIENWPLDSDLLAPTLHLKNFSTQTAQTVGHQCEEVKVKQHPDDDESQQPSAKEHVIASPSEHGCSEMNQDDNEHLSDPIRDVVLRFDSMDNEDLMAYFGPN